MYRNILRYTRYTGGSVVEWLACWTGLRRRRAWVQIAAATLWGNTLRQTVHTHCASVQQAAKLVAALRFVRVTAGLAESNNSIPPGLWLTSLTGWLPRTAISSGTLRSVIEYVLPFYRKIFIWYYNSTSWPKSRRKYPCFVNCHIFSVININIIIMKKMHGTDFTYFFRLVL